MKTETIRRGAITQKDIAQYLGVSRPWVARALNGDPKISEHSRQRVLLAARELGYDARANEAARSMAAQRHGRRASKGVIGCLGFTFGEGLPFPYMVHLVEGIQSAARESGREILLLGDHTGADLSRVDGVIVQREEFPGECERISQHVPVVSLIELTSGITSVGVDDYGGARRATEYLLSLGHRKIAYLTDAYTPECHLPLSQARLAGYQDALKAAGITPRKSWIGHLRNDGEFLRRGRTSMRVWLEAGWRKMGCTALLVLNDRAAVGAMDALHEAGLGVPEDVSVIGFDSTDECDLCRPTLTSVRVPLREIGARGVQELQRLLEGREKSGQPDEVFDIRLPTEIEVRDSTAPPAK